MTVSTVNDLVAILRRYPCWIVCGPQVFKEMVRQLKVEWDGKSDVVEWSPHTIKRSPIADDGQIIAIRKSAACLGFEGVDSSCFE